MYSLVTVVFYFGIEWEIDVYSITVCKASY